MALEEVSQLYFRSVNPIAGRIAEDIDGVKSAYRGVWEKLNITDRIQVLDEALIDPAAVLRYSNCREEAGGCYRSSKFSWFTQSQLNLFSPNITHLEAVKSPSKKTEHPPMPSLPPDNPPVKRLSPKHPPLPAKAPSSNNRGPSAEPKSRSGVLKVFHKPKNPPPPPPPGRPVPVITCDVGSNEDIPKTGFDFLDNW